MYLLAGARPTLPPRLSLLGQLIFILISNLLGQEHIPHMTERKAFQALPFSPENMGEGSSGTGQRRLVIRLGVSGG